MSPSNMQYLYRGFAFNDGSSIFGKQWFAVTWDPKSDGSHWRFEYIKEKYNGDYWHALPKDVAKFVFNQSTTVTVQSKKLIDIVNEK